MLEVWARRRQVAGRVRGAVGWREGGAPGERGHAQTRDGSSAPAPSLPSQPSAAATHTTASPQAQAQPARPHPPEALECVPDLLHGRHGGDVSHIQLQRICGRRREEGGGGCGRGQHRRQLLDGGWLAASAAGLRTMLLHTHAARKQRTALAAGRRWLQRDVLRPKPHAVFAPAQHGGNGGVVGVGRGGRGGVATACCWAAATSAAAGPPPPPPSAVRAPPPQPQAPTDPLLTAACCRRFR